MRKQHHRGMAGARLLALAIVALAGVGLGLFGEATRPALADANTNGSFQFANGSNVPTTGTTVTEGAIVCIPIHRSGGTTGQQSVEVTRSLGVGAAAADVANYPETGQQAIFQAGVTDRNIDWPTGPCLTTNDDLSAQGAPRTITFTIGTITGDINGTGVPGIQTTFALTILDNDGPPNFSFSQPNYPVNENAGTVTITVNRSGAVNQAVSVEYQTINGSATASGDYTAIPPTTLSFSSVQTSRTFTVAITNDLVSEPTQAFSVHLLNPSSGSVGSDSTVTINDDDGTGTLQWNTLTSFTTSEGVGTHTASFSVSRVGGSSGSVGTTCSTTGGSATISTEYDPIPLAGGSLVWSNGDSSDKVCQITIYDDLVQDGNKTFGLALSGGPLGAPTTATVTIQDDDGTGNLAFSSSVYSGSETSGFVTITVTRTGGSGIVGVTYTASAGTAVAGVDFTPTTSVLSWGPSEFDDRTFTVAVLDDGVADGAKTVLLTLSAPSGGATLGLPASAVLTISDNESAFPIITSITPTAGTTFGGTTVGITGSNFTGTTLVTFDGLPGTGLVVNSNFSLTIVTPAHSAGTVDVIVTNAAGSNTTAGTANDFTYTTGPTVTSLSPDTGPASGTTFVTISGTNFITTGLIVKFGGVTATASLVDAQTIIAVAPAHSAGTVDVIVTTAGGASPNTILDDYTYTGTTVPVVTAVTPVSGPAGTQVVISGSGFTGATLVTFGGVSGTFTVNSDISISATVPAAAPGGTIDVRVTTPSGQSANTSADNFNNTSGGGSGVTTTYTLYFRWTLLAWSGIDNISVTAAVTGLESPDNPATNNVSGTILVIWFWDGSVQHYLGNFPGSSAPGANDFTTLKRGNSYWIAVSAQVSWTVIQGN